MLLLSAEELYHKLGWQVVERTKYFGKEAVVMQIDLISRRLDERCRDVED